VRRPSPRPPRDSGHEHRVVDVTTDRPGISFIDAAGGAQEVRCDYLVGADGSRSICRQEIPVDLRRDHFREDPFAWFGILCEAPRSAPDLTTTTPSAGSP